MELEAVCNTAATSLAMDWSKLEKLSLDESEALSLSERRADEYLPPMLEVSLPEPSLLLPPEPLPPPLPEPGPDEAPDCLKAL